ncbi:MAG: xanthine dehydrogenase subunit D [bacterium]|nr:xanthine dehydrogenase subunit D [bacterium]MXV89661.1 xanthine dehydrogenase subunit D [Acidimicrobiia bacterium]MYC45204.1 xanthine dehydrogenase subunit D [Acidimicrobiia bacterium]
MSGKTGAGVTLNAAAGVEAPARPRTTGRIGESVARPDGIPKTTGAFAFSSDLWADGMLWGRALRSPHPHARIRSINIAPALAIGGVRAVLTADDVPGTGIFGIEHADQPVLAADVVRYCGEPVAVVAADHPETARLAAEAIEVDYEPLPPVTDATAAADAPPIHPDGNLFRHIRIRHGDPAATGDIVVEGDYEVGMQDQAFMGTESGLAMPTVDGGVELFISTQWLHNDQRQIADALGLAPADVHLTLAGVGGAFGAREDVTLQIHLCLLALHTQRPVKMLYNREESFFGHVHRHPARMRYRHHATADGRLVNVEAEIILDGGAYASTTAAVLANASFFATGPYKVPNAAVDGWGMRTNNPPCGAMRGFGVVQVCFAHEAQMDRLADALGIDPLELRLRNALEPGDTLITGQQITGTAPVAELLEALGEYPLPQETDGAGRHGSGGNGAAGAMARPGGAGRTADDSHVRRGVGYAASIKNLMFSEGFDDYSTAACRLSDGVATITCACVEVGQGFVTLAQQIAREVLGVQQVLLDPADTAIGSAGSSSASRQTWMSGGAVLAACEGVRDKVLAYVSAECGIPPTELSLRDGQVISASGLSRDLADISAERDFRHEIEYHHAPTTEVDADGQGEPHVSFAFAAHRAVVDVDGDLGLLRTVEVATTQDVGRILNPQQAVGQIEGGIAQGVGLAVMEEIVLDGGRVRNASFTDYLIPTALDMCDVRIARLVEEPEPGAPFGAKGIGEPPTISSTPAVVAAVRQATGLALNRVPIRPSDIALHPDRNPRRS